MKIKNYTLKLFATYLLIQIFVGQVHSQEISEMKPRSLPGFKAKSQNEQKLAIKKEKEIVREKRSQVSTKAPGDTLFFQNFQGAAWPANMLRLNVDGKTPAANAALFGNNAWVVATTAATGTNRMAGSTSYFTPVGVANRWMVLPPITLTQGNKLRWKAKAFEPQAPDGYEVRICTTCTTAPTVGNVVANFTSAPPLFSIAAEQSGLNLIEREVDLSGYQGQTVRLAFRNNSNDQFILFIDDILVFKLPAVDISAERIFSPDTSIYRCNKSNFPAVVQIKNKGGTTAKNIKVKLESFGPVTDSVVTFVDSVEAGQLDTVRFNSGLDLSKIGDYQLKLSTYIETDLIKSNNISLDKYTHPAPVDAPISFNFEELDNDENSLPPYWNSSSIFIPLIRNEGFNGGNALRFPVYNNNGTFGDAPENNFITNEFTGIQAGQSFNLKYKIFSNTAPDYTMVESDTVYFSVIKNCTLAGPPVLVTAANQIISSDYQKVFIPLAELGITPSDTISFEIRAKAAPATAWYFVEIDDVAVSTVQDNDVAIINIQRPPFSIVKRNQVTPFQVKGLVFNEGTTPISPVRISATLTPLGIQDTARVNTVGAGLSRNFSTGPGFNISTLGEYTIDINTLPTSQTDPNQENNLVSIPLTISDSTLGKDYGDPFVSEGGTSGLGYGTQGGLKIMATSMSTKAKDTLTSVSVFVGSLTSDVVGKAFFASTNAVGAFVLDSSSTAVTIPVDEENAWHTFRFRLRGGLAALRDRGRAVLPNTTNLYGVKISTGDLRVGFNFENAVDDGSYIYFGTALTGTQEITIFNLSGPFNLFIRPNFGRPSTMVSISQIEKSLQYAELVPNPSNGQSTLSIQLNKAKNLGIQIFSTDGRLINTKSAFTNVGDNRIDLPVSGLTKGIYLVKVAVDGFSVTKKLVVE